jgi:membrane protein DedA with SNARE-associated domain
LVMVVAGALLFDPAEDFLVDSALHNVSSSSAFASVVQGMVPAITSTMESWGYGGVFFLMLAESVSLPLPSEVILPYAGYLVFIGRLDFWVTISLSTAAGTAGALVDYYLGLRISQTSSRGLLRRLPLVDEKLLVLVGQWFERHSSSTVFISRMLPGVRTLASFPAGATRMPILRFVAYTASGCLIWSTLLTYMGVYLGRNWDAMLHFSGYLSIITVSVAGIALAGWLVFKRRRKANSAII